MNPLEYLKKLNLPINEYLVFGSALLAVKDIKPLNDIDLLVSRDLYESLKNKGWKENITVTTEASTERISYDIVEAFVDFQGKSFDEWKEDFIGREIVHGIHFLSLEEILKIKKEWKREKDIIDVQLIEEYLEKSRKDKY